jgi:hypothetical protein
LPVVFTVAEYGLIYGFAHVIIYGVFATQQIWRFYSAV